MFNYNYFYEKCRSILEGWFNRLVDIMLECILGKTRVYFFKSDSRDWNNPAYKFIHNSAVSDSAAYKLAMFN